MKRKKKDRRIIHLSERTTGQKLLRTMAIRELHWYKNDIIESMYECKDNSTDLKMLRCFGKGNGYDNNHNNDDHDAYN